MRAKKIRELVKIVEESNIAELEITQWPVGKIRISKQLPAPSASAQETSHSKPVKEVSFSNVTTAAETGEEPKTEETGHLVEIPAPMVGTFYRAPAPDSEPYIKVNDSVSPGKVLCIIEAMKLMNEIEAEVSGKIVKVLIQDAQPVEYNQPMFLVEPV